MNAGPRVAMSGDATSGGLLRHAVTLSVLGIGVRFESNEAAPVDLAREAFGSWQGPDPGPAAEVAIRILVAAGVGGRAGHAPLAYELEGPERVVISTPDSRVVSDAASRIATGSVTDTLVADRQHFRYGVLEACTLFILTRLDRIPVHAAVVTRGEAALLLAGPSGAGKTTLAYGAATRLGCRVLAEDVVYVQMRPTLRIWGLPGFLHMPAGAGAHFPELAAEPPSLMANGKEKIAVALARIGALPVRPSASRAGICVLERGAGPASLEPLAPDRIAAALTAALEPGFDLFASDIDECSRALAARGGWRMRTSGRPGDALPLVDEALSVLEREP
jgi:hypothetical protein